VWPDGSIYRIIRFANTGGQLLEMEWELPAHSWAPQSHVRPRLTEEYEVLDGSLVGGVDLPGRRHRWHVGLGWGAEAPTVLHPPARAVGLVVRIGLTLGPQLFLKAPLGLLQPLRPRPRDRLGLVCASLIQPLLGITQPPPASVRG
jgi:hypothetical protein